MPRELTSEYFESCDVKVYQPKRGHRYGRESVDLASYCSFLEKENVVEFGAGVGVISLVMAKKFPSCKISAIEIQKSLYDVALNNIKENGLEENVTLFNCDYRDFAKDRVNFEKFDAVVSNPPFYKVEEGRVSENVERAVARHEINGNIEDILNCSHIILKKTGHLFVVFNKDRFDEFMSLTLKIGFEVVDKKNSESDDAFLIHLVKK